jgi:hypothetical protein
MHHFWKIKVIGSAVCIEWSYKQYQTVGTMLAGLACRTPHCWLADVPCHLVTLTTQITNPPSSTIHLENLILRSAIQETISSSYWAQIFVTVFTIGRHRSLSWATWTQSAPRNNTVLISVLILSFHVWLAYVFLVISSLQSFRPKYWKSFSSAPFALHALPISSSLLWSC